MRRVFALAVLGCAFFVAGASPAQAACAPPAPDALAFYPVVLVGVAAPGPEVNGTLLSPATVRVVRYFKGNGPLAAKVQTSFTNGPTPGTLSGIEDEPGLRAGERWLLYGVFRADGVLDTACSPSHRLTAGEPVSLTAVAPLARTGSSTSQLALVAVASLLVGGLCVAAVRKPPVR